MQSLGWGDENKLWKNKELRMEFFYDIPGFPKISSGGCWEKKFTPKCIQHNQSIILFYFFSDEG